MPEGEYGLLVGGLWNDETIVPDMEAPDALRRNGTYNDGAFSKYAAVEVAKYVDIITPAPSETVEVKKFSGRLTIGSTSYLANGTTKTMDVVPYIDEAWRTMVPARFIADICGLTDDDITWDQENTTATFKGHNNVVTITVGDNVLKTSNGDITMDTVAVNRDSRVYVPARFIAEAFGAEVTWNPTTRTVNIQEK